MNKGIKNLYEIFRNKFYSRKCTTFAVVLDGRLPRDTE